MPGPTPKPTVLKILAGNPGKRKLNDSEPKPLVIKLNAPRYLNDLARAEWRRIMPELCRLGLFSLVDRASLAAYCQAYGDWLEAEEMLEQDGKVLTTDKGYRYLNPWWSVRCKSLELMDKFGSRFGFDPSSRTRLKVEANEKGMTLAEMLFTGLGDE